MVEVERKESVALVASFVASLPDLQMWFTYYSCSKSPFLFIESVQCISQNMFLGIIDGSLYDLTNLRVGEGLHISIGCGVKEVFSAIFRIAFLRIGGGLGVVANAISSSSFLGVSLLTEPLSSFLPQAPPSWCKPPSVILLLAKRS